MLHTIKKSFGHGGNESLPLLGFSPSVTITSSSWSKLLDVVICIAWHLMKAENSVCHDHPYANKTLTQLHMQGKKRIHLHQTSGWCPVSPKFRKARLASMPSVLLANFMNSCMSPVVGNIRTSREGEMRQKWFIRMKNSGNSSRATHFQKKVLQCFATIESLPTSHVQITTTDLRLCPIGVLFDEQTRRHLVYWLPSLESEYGYSTLLHVASWSSQVHNCDLYFIPCRDPSSQVSITRKEVEGNF